MDQTPDSVPPPPQPGRPIFYISRLIIIGLIFLACFLGLWRISSAFSPAAQAPRTQIQIHAASASPQSTSTTQVATTTGLVVPKDPEVGHVSMPDEVRGFYWTGWTAGSKRVDELMKYAVSSKLNTVVIDLKIEDGTLSFKPKDPKLEKYAPEYPAIRDLDTLLENLREKKIYRIARIFVMQDKLFATLNPEAALRTSDAKLWRDKKGMLWLDPAAPQVADYAVELAREAYARGFDEAQFDYVRFPTDGEVSAIVYPIFDSATTTKAKVMKAFFRHLKDELVGDGIPFSYDLYGMTFWRTDDFQIGQRMADAYPDAAAISPMVYPSHYPKNFQGFSNPAEHPYEIVKQSLDKGMDILWIDYPELDSRISRKKFRPWIQDFDLGAEYDAAKIEAQIKAARDASAGGWLIWNARNIYTPARYVK